MNKILMTASALALGATAASAGGVERSSQSVGILFEKGTYAELSFGGFSPDVSGTNNLGGAGIGAPNASSGDMAVGYGTYSLGYKQALSDKLDLAIILDEPLGAKLSYPGATGYPVGGVTGATASLDSTALTALLRYKLANNFSIIGGIRAERVSGNVKLAFPVPSTMSTSTETDFGYVVGVAWEKPEIAARVALTYNSKITHDFDAAETVGVTLSNTVFTTVVPESVNLEFQTGIAANTLLMGSVRWVHWTQFDITPPAYAGTTVPGLGQLGSLVDYANNTVTWNIGVGRKFNDQWSGAVMLGYEKHQGGQSGNLGPTDGYKSIAIAASYQATENLKITGGLRYVDIGDTFTSVGTFSGNSGWGAGVKVGYSF